MKRRYDRDEDARGHRAEDAAKRRRQGEAGRGIAPCGLDAGRRNGEEHASAGVMRGPSTKGPETTVRMLSTEREQDAHRLAQRQKQIDYGKNTLGYDRYCVRVPRHKRRKGDPMTPDATLKVSKKAFDGMVRRWRQALHEYDPPGLSDAAQLVATAVHHHGEEHKPADTKKVAEDAQSNHCAPSDANDHQAQPSAIVQQTAKAAALASLFDDFGEDEEEHREEKVDDDDDDDDDDLL